MGRSSHVLQETALCSTLQVPRWQVSISLHIMEGCYTEALSIDGGQCFFQLGLMDGYRITFASLSEVQSAANAILTKCKKENRLQGGTVTNAGQYDDLISGDTLYCLVRALTIFRRRRRTHHGLSRVPSSCRMPGHISAPRILLYDHGRYGDFAGIGDFCSQE